MGNHHSASELFKDLPDNWDKGWDGLNSQTISSFIQLSPTFRQAVTSRLSSPDLAWLYPSLDIHPSSEDPEISTACRQMTALMSVSMLHFEQHRHNRQIVSVHKHKALQEYIALLGDGGSGRPGAKADVMASLAKDMLSEFIKSIEQAIGRKDVVGLLHLLKELSELVNKSLSGQNVSSPQGDQLNALLVNTIVNSLEIIKDSAPSKTVDGLLALAVRLSLVTSTPLLRLQVIHTLFEYSSFLSTDFLNDLEMPSTISQESVRGEISTIPLQNFTYSPDMKLKDLGSRIRISTESGSWTDYTKWPVLGQALILEKGNEVQSHESVISPEEGYRIDLVPEGVKLRNLCRIHAQKVSKDWKGCLLLLQSLLFSKPRPSSTNIHPPRDIDLQSSIFPLLLSILSRCLLTSTQDPSFLLPLLDILDLYLSWASTLQSVAPSTVKFLSQETVGRLRLYLTSPTTLDLVDKVSAEDRGRVDSLLLFCLTSLLSLSRSVKSLLHPDGYFSPLLSPNTLHSPTAVQGYLEEIFALSDKKILDPHAIMRQLSLAITKAVQCVLNEEERMASAGGSGSLTYSPLMSILCSNLHSIIPSLLSQPSSSGSSIPFASVLGVFAPKAAQIIIANKNNQRNWVERSLSGTIVLLPFLINLWSKDKPFNALVATLTTALSAHLSSLPKPSPQPLLPTTLSIPSISTLLYRTIPLPSGHSHTLISTHPSTLTVHILIDDGCTISDIPTGQPIPIPSIPALSIILCPSVSTPSAVSVSITHNGCTPTLSSSMHYLQAMLSYTHVDGILSVLSLSLPVHADSIHSIQSVLSTDIFNDIHNSRDILQRIHAYRIKGKDSGDNREYAKIVGEELGIAQIGSIDDLVLALCKRYNVPKDSVHLPKMGMNSSKIVRRVLDVLAILMMIEPGKADPSASKGLSTLLALPLESAEELIDCIVYIQEMQKKYVHVLENISKYEDANMLRFIIDKYLRRNPLLNGSLIPLMNKALTDKARSLMTNIMDRILSTQSADSKDEGMIIEGIKAGLESKDGGYTRKLISILKEGYKGISSTPAVKVNSRDYTRDNGIESIARRLVSENKGKAREDGWMELELPKTDSSLSATKQSQSIYSPSLQSQSLWSNRCKSILSFLSSAASTGQISIDIVKQELKGLDFTSLRPDLITMHRKLLGEPTIPITTTTTAPRAPPGKVYARYSSLLYTTVRASSVSSRPPPLETDNVYEIIDCNVYPRGRTERTDKDKYKTEWNTGAYHSALTGDPYPLISAAISADRTSIDKDMDEDIIREIKGQTDTTAQSIEDHLPKKRIGMAMWEYGRRDKREYLSNIGHWLASKIRGTPLPSQDELLTRASILSSIQSNPSKYFPQGDKFTPEYSQWLALVGDHSYALTDTSNGITAHYRTTYKDHLQVPLGYPISLDTSREYEISAKPLRKNYLVEGNKSSVMESLFPSDNPSPITGSLSQSYLLVEDKIYSKNYTASSDFESFTLVDDYVAWGMVMNDGLLAYYKYSTRELFIEVDNSYEYKRWPVQTYTHFKSQFKMLRIDMSLYPIMTRIILFNKKYVGTTDCTGGLWLVNYGGEVGYDTKLSDDKKKSECPDPPNLLEAFTNIYRQDPDFRPLSARERRESITLFKSKIIRPVRAQKADSTLVLISANSEGLDVYKCNADGDNIVKFSVPRARLKIASIYQNILCILLQSGRIFMVDIDHSSSFGKEMNISTNGDRSNDCALISQQNNYTGIGKFGKSFAVFYRDADSGRILAKPLFKPDNEEELESIVSLNDKIEFTDKTRLNNLDSQDASTTMISYAAKKIKEEQKEEDTSKPKEEEGFPMPAPFACRLSPDMKSLEYLPAVQINSISTHHSNDLLLIVCKTFLNDMTPKILLRLFQKYRKSKDEKIDEKYMIAMDDLMFFPSPECPADPDQLECLWFTVKVDGNGREGLSEFCAQMTGEIFKDPDNDDLDNNGKDNKNIIANIIPDVIRMDISSDEFNKIKSLTESEWKEQYDELKKVFGRTSKIIFKAYSEKSGHLDITNFLNSTLQSDKIYKDYIDQHKEEKEGISDKMMELTHLALRIRVLQFLDYYHAMPIYQNRNLDLDTLTAMDDTLLPRLREDLIREVQVNTDHTISLDRTKSTKLATPTYPSPSLLHQYAKSLEAACNQDKGIQRQNIKKRFQFIGEPSVNPAEAKTLFYLEVCQEITSRLKLFIPSFNTVYEEGEEQGCLVPNPSIQTDAQMISYYHVGVLLADALINKIPLNLRFPSIFWKYLLGCAFTWENIPSIKKSLYEDITRTANSPSDNIDSAQPAHHPQGMDTEDKDRYVQMVKDREINLIDKVYRKIRDGFTDTVQPQYFIAYTPATLEAAICAPRSASGN
jgi:hypothetical protein